MSFLRWRDNGKQYASMTVSKPLARSDELVVEELEGETLVYDDKNSRAHCLTGSAARVWQNCDGQHSVEELASNLDLDVYEVQRALSELDGIALLDVGPVMSNG